MQKCLYVFLHLYTATPVALRALTRVQPIQPIFITLSVLWFFVQLLNKNVYAGVGALKLTDESNIKEM